MPQSKRPGQWWKTTTLTIGTIPRYSENGVLANFMWTRALATVWCTFCRPRLPNSAPSPSVFNFCDFELQIELSVQSCALFSRQLLQIEPRTCGNRDSTSATTEAGSHFTRKKPRVSRPRDPEGVFTREFPCSRTVTLPNYLMMGGWHDDVVAMMVGLLTVTIVPNLEVF